MVKDYKETAYNYIVGEKTGTFFTSEQKWINKFKKLADEHPSQIKILHENEDGSIVAEAPVKGFKYSLPKQRKPLTEEEKKKLALRLEKARNNKAKMTA